MVELPTSEIRNTRHRPLNNKKLVIDAPFIHDMKNTLAVKTKLCCSSSTFYDSGSGFFSFFDIQFTSHDRNPRRNIRGGALPRLGFQNIS